MDDFNAHGDIGILHANALFGERFTQASTDDLVHVHRVRLKIGVISPRLHLERFKRLAFCERVNSDIAHYLKVTLALETARNARNAGNRSQPIGDFKCRGTTGALFEEHAKSSRNTVYRHDGICCQNGFYVL